MKVCFFKRIWWSSLIGGGLLLAFDLALAIAHYLFGAPVHDGYSRQLMSAQSVAQVFLLIGVGAAFFSLLGAVMLLNRQD